MPRKQQSNNQISVDIAVMAEKVDNIDRVVSSIQTKLEKDYVTQDQFAPVRNIVFGMVSIILATVVTALVYLVVRK